MKAILVLVTFCVTLAALVALPQPSAQAIGVLRVTSTAVIVPTHDPNATPYPTATPAPAAYPYPAPQAERPAATPTPAPRHARPMPRCRGPLAALACGEIA